MTIQQTQIGIGDRPLQPNDEDELGIGDYAKALQQFIGECDTPLTIGIQGDWGSGKTSLMNLIKPAQDTTQLRTVWINTWQYAQLGDPETLFLAVLAGVADKLATLTGNCSHRKLQSRFKCE